MQAPVLQAQAAAIDAGESPTRVLAIAGGIPGLAAAADVSLAMAPHRLVQHRSARRRHRQPGRFSSRLAGPASSALRLPALRSHFLSILSIALPIAMIFCTQSEPIQSTIDLTNVMVLLWLIPNGLICAAAVRRFDGQDRRGATEVLAAVQVVAVAILAGVSLLRPINRESGVVDALGAVMIAVASVLFFKLGNENGPPQREPGEN